MTDTEKKRYSKYRFNKDPELIYQQGHYYVARNWGVNNLQKFIDKIEAKFPDVKFTISHG